MGAIKHYIEEIPLDPRMAQKKVFSSKCDDGFYTGSSNSDCAKVKAYKVPLKLLLIHNKGIIAFARFGHLTI